MSSKVIKAMENIDDECDEQGIIFVKTGDEKKARMIKDPNGRKSMDDDD